MRIHALLFFLFSQSALALYGESQLIQANFLVRLKISGETFCQGILVAPRKVLTTAHCIEAKGHEIREEALLLTYYPEVVSVTLGTDSVTAKRISIAPGYFDSHGIEAQDLALIELPRSLMNGIVLPIGKTSDVQKGSTVSLVSGNRRVRTTVREVRRGLDGPVVITDGAKVGACQGDSGGALVREKEGRMELVGVLAAQGSGCARRHSVSHFPRLRF